MTSLFELMSGGQERISSHDENRWKKKKFQVSHLSVKK